MTELKTVDDISEEEYLRDHMVPHSLTPSPEGRECLGNGSWVGHECCCEECDHYLVCFPDAMSMISKGGK